MTTIDVRVQADHLERLTKVKKPIIALAELIWNGLDADATEVRVGFAFDVTGTLQEIVVEDNGTGMARTVALESFGSLGGSWKRAQGRSRQAKRMLHGRGGKGRFRAFALGNVVEWTTTAKNSSNDLESFTVLGALDHLGKFEVSEAVPSSGTKTGTRVVISEIQKNFPSLLGPDAAQEITEEFAIYLRKYPDVEITYNGIEIDAATIEKSSTELQLGTVEDEEGKPYAASLDIIEWKMQTERHLFLCDADGFALHRVSPGVQAPGFSFSAYLKCDLIRVLDESHSLELEEGHPALARLLEAARKALKDYFRIKLSSAARELVEEWKKTKVYPYEGEPESELDEVRRQVFDVVATNVHEYLPVSPTSSKTQRFSFKLLREALEDSPEALQRIINEVLDLPQEKREDLAALLETHNLSALITASKMVTERLHFIEGLKVMCFDHEARKVVKERRHLHKILAKETWVFGEEFHLSLSDKNLSAVLAEHRRLLGDEVEFESDPVLCG